MREFKSYSCSPHHGPSLARWEETGTRLRASETSPCGCASSWISLVQLVTPHRGRWGNLREYRGGRASQFPVESDSSEFSSTWTSFCHFLSPPSLHRIHGQGHHPRHSTKNSSSWKQTVLRSWSLWDGPKTARSHRWLSRLQPRCLRKARLLWLWIHFLPSSEIRHS